MRILLNLTQLGLSRTGIDTYTENLAIELVRLRKSGDDIRAIVLDDDVDIAKNLRDAGHVAILSLPARLLRNRITPLLFEQLVLPFIAWKYKSDVVHCFRYNFPMVGTCARVVTVHDLSAFLWPETVPFFRRVLVRFFTRMAMKNAEGVVFVSASCLTDAEKLFGRGKQLRAAIPLGVSANQPGGQPCLVLERLGIQPPFLLFIGSNDPRKNLARLIGAFNRVAANRPNLSLVIAGSAAGRNPALVEAFSSSPFANRIHRCGYISNGDKAALLASCAALAYPSLYEGFGLPILEAMMAGAPVIASTSGSMPEVAGNCALLADPMSPADIARQIEHVLADDRIRLHLIEAGRQWTKQFTWAKTAEATYRLYEDCCRRKSANGGYATQPTSAI